MISRRLLRIKALTVLYAFNRKEGDDLKDAEKELEVSIEKAYDLYLYLLLLLVELAHIAQSKIDIALQKQIPTHQDLNPNRRFADNSVIARIAKDSSLTAAAYNSGVSWSGSSEIAGLLFKQMLSWEPYNRYLEEPDTGPAGDRKFIMRLLAEKLLTSDDLIQHLEEKSIYWNDDIGFALLMADKTIRKTKDSDGNASLLIPLYRNDDDALFIKSLLRTAVLKSDIARRLIESNTTNWEIERIALMDILVMQLAIAEVMAFPEIPVKVTYNEYIEISKYYCTSKSSTFINGILDKVVREMRREELFVKTGRGLVGEEPAHGGDSSSEV